MQEYDQLKDMVVAIEDDLTKAEGGDDSIEGLYDMGLPLCYGNFLDGDFNEDCYIDLLDFGVLSTDWMDGYSLDDNLFHGCVLDCCEYFQPVV